MQPIEALLEVLRSEGVDRVFGNPGTTELPLLDVLAEAPDLPYVLGLQEGSVVAMADGYARATGRASLASPHVAAGLANGLIGMLNAARSRTPMVVLAGQQDRRHLVQDPMLSGDLVGIATPAAKSAVEVQHVHDLVPLLRRAFALAAQPPAGPVSVSVPMNLLEEEAEVEVPPRSHLAPPALDWPAAARLFGMPSVRVTGPGDLGDAVAGIEALQGPVLVEVPVTGHRSAGGQGAAGP